MKKSIQFLQHIQVAIKSMSRDMTKTSHATVEVAIESTSPDMTKHAPHAIVKRTINETQHYLKKKNRNKDLIILETIVAIETM